MENQPVSSQKKFEKIESPRCPVRTTLDMIGGKWPFAIIYALLEGKKRFKELERSIEGINTRMLVKELKALEQWGIVHREAYATVPPTVEYSLTDKGLELQPVLKEIQNWALKYI